MRPSSPGQPTNTCKCTSSPQLRNLQENWSKNQTADIKVTKHNLFSARGLPEFSDSEWIKVLQQKAVNLNVMLSRIHLTASDNWATEAFRDFEFQFGHTKLVKSVKSYGKWLIAFSAFQCAMWFVFLNQEGKLCNMSMSHTSHLLNQSGTPGCSTSTKQLGSGPDQLTMFHLMTLPSLDSWKSDTSTVRSMWKPIWAAVSEGEEQGRKPPTSLGDTEGHVDCTIKGNGVRMQVQRYIHAIQQRWTC